MFWQSVKACGYIPRLSEEAGSREAKVQAKNTKFMSVLLHKLYPWLTVGGISGIL